MKLPRILALPRDNKEESSLFLESATMLGSDFQSREQLLPFLHQFARSLLKQAVSPSRHVCHYNDQQTVQGLKAVEVLATATKGNMTTPILNWTYP